MDIFGLPSVINSAVDCAQISKKTYTESFPIIILFELINIKCLLIIYSAYFSISNFNYYQLFHQ